MAHTKTFSVEDQADIYVYDPETKQNHHDGQYLTDGLSVSDFPRANLAKNRESLAGPSQSTMVLHLY